MLQMRKYYPEGKEYMRHALGVYEIYFPAETPQIESKHNYNDYMCIHVHMYINKVLAILVYVSIL